MELCRYRYNHFRPHESLDMKTPGEIFNDLSKLY
ncbi:MAG: transposase [Nanoarchaeota archaeon]|nr:transposase [Nanoarchaeota archaeon]MBU4117116.1 transposase [Nanoarchaeota archaeon]